MTFTDFRDCLQAVDRDGELKRVSGADWNLAFKFEPPQDVQFNGLEMKFTIGSLTGDNWQVGFCRPGRFDAWRGK